MKTEHIVLVGLIVLIVVFVMNQQKKEHNRWKRRRSTGPIRCGDTFKSTDYYYNEIQNGHRCRHNCECDGLRTCSAWGWCAGRAR